MEEAASASKSRVFRLLLEYDGSDFEGWQIQSRQSPVRTVQGVIVDALVSVSGGPVRVRGAGRTDAGVHAMGQVASVRVTTGLEAEALLRALNSRLPRDIAVLACGEVPDDWDALRAARSKHYRYQIWNGPTRSPLRAGRWYWIRDRLALEPMREAARAFVGTHDFAAMQAAGSSVKTSVRTLTALVIEGQTGGEIVFDVEGEGFLRHMVRNLAGTLIEIGRGRWPATRAAQIMASLDRGQAGPTAPARGLVLVSIRDGWNPDFDRKVRSAGRSVDERGPVG